MLAHSVINKNDKPKKRPARLAGGRQYSVRSAGLAAGSSRRTGRTLYRRAGLFEAFFKPLLDAARVSGPFRCAGLAVVSWMRLEGAARSIGRRLAKARRLFAVIAARPVVGGTIAFDGWRSRAGRMFFKRFVVPVFHAIFAGRRRFAFAAQRGGGVLPGRRRFTFAPRRWGGVLPGRRRFAFAARPTGRVVSSWQPFAGLFRLFPGR